MNNQKYKLVLKDDQLFVKDSDGDFVFLDSEGERMEEYISESTVVDLGFEVEEYQEPPIVPSELPAGTLVKVAGETFTYYRSYAGWVAAGYQLYTGESFPSTHLNGVADKLVILYDPRKTSDNYQDTRTTRL